MNICIYKITNTLTGKAYIGATDNLRKRIASHKRQSNCNDLFHRDILKYGWDKFKVEILSDGICADEDADQKEREAIREHNTIAPNGYNKQRGGGRKRPLVTEEAKRKAASLLHVPYSGRGA
ncbi:MAG: hypothetical protein MOGMAGMI_02012 [Candidatus Omnitrophica bacterium]|nr:hypothetical protein [Candidatus Omnitrophota bacterium]